MSTTRIKQATLIILMYPDYKSVQYELLGKVLVLHFITQSQNVVWLLDRINVLNRISE